MSGPFSDFDQTKMLSNFEISKRLLRYNLTGNFAELGSCHPLQEVCFMYPHMTTTIGGNREAELFETFGPLDETEEEFNKRIESRHV